ncbi:hypothetical protein [Sphingobium yanoikuyae]|uniref:hypothetical protein n=1 Tax=Sphingobium yanoikuyae TaxID=13690 RepID=UPI0026EA9998|nr:hypothetical protein [Sphingobium yanoikuyae]
MRPTLPVFSDDRAIAFCLLASEAGQAHLILIHFLADDPADALIKRPVFRRLAFRFRGGRASDRHYAAALAGLVGRGASCCTSASSIAESDFRLAPTGFGFLSDLFHLLNVVGWTPAASHTWLIGRPSALARASKPAIMVC